MSSDLFSTAEPVAAPAPAAPAPREDAVDPVSLMTPEQAVASVDPEPLPETLDALKRIPEGIRPSFERAAAARYSALFMDAVLMRIAAKGLANDPAQSLALLSHSVKIDVLSQITAASYAPWHLADAKVLARIAAEVDKGVELDKAVRHLTALKPLNLFVAAQEDDDRDSYLKAVTTLLKRHKVRDIVLDAELIEWAPEADFLEACQQIGLAPVHVGIADRSAASRHSIMSQQGRLEPVPALFVDTRGRQLELDAQGRVQLVGEQEPAPAPRATRAATSASTVNPEELAAVPPSSAIQSRIQALRASQSRRSGARP